MRGQSFVVLAAAGLTAFAYAGGRPGLLPEIRQHLDLARRCAGNGQIDIAIAHAGVVTPDRALRVRVDCTSVLPAQQGLYRNALNSAFRMWEQALGQTVYVASETGPADVVVQFVPGLSDRGTEICGHSEWMRGVLNPDNDPTVVFSAKVQVRMQLPNGTPLSFDQLRACAAHELGHVLGLEDSSAKGDLMGPMDFAHPVTEIKADEAEALLRARNEAKQIRKGMMLRAAKLRE